MGEAPLILTLRFDEASFARFDAERRLHFPPARNHIPAHLTLFHHLPGERRDEIAAQLSALAGRQAPFPLRVASLRFFGQGTAYAVDSEELHRLRAAIADRWEAQLTRQDASRFAPHVTIQNKVEATAAKSLFASLSAAFRPFEAMATGLLLWRYRGGPWEAEGSFPFTGRSPEDAPVPA